MIHHAIALFAVSHLFLSVSTFAQNSPAPTQVRIQCLVEIEFPTELGTDYQIQFSPTASADAEWRNIGQPIEGTGRPLKLGVRRDGRNGFFRVRAIVDQEKEVALDEIIGLSSLLSGAEDPETVNENETELPALTVIQEAEKSPANPAAKEWIRYIAYYQGEPIGDLMTEGDGLLDSARRTEEKTPGYEVKLFRITAAE